MSKPTKRATRPAIGQPHDGLVKYAFSKREHAEGLLKAILDPAVVALVDWTTLELMKDSFIDRALLRRHADLLLSAWMGDRKVLFYVLIEHQRRVEALMIFRIAQYMMRIWDKLLRDEPDREKLPAIVPVLLSNGVTGWTAATSFEDIVDVPEAAREALMPHVPCFQMRLVDLHPARARGVVEEMLTAFGKVVLWALSVAGNDQRFLAEIDRMADAINAALDAPDAHDALFVLLQYLVATHARLGAKRIGNLLQTRAAKRQERAIMDVLDELRQEGREEGREEGQRIGERIGRAQLLLRQLTARFGPVPKATRAQILAAKEAALDRWALRVLTAPSLQAVLAASTPRAKKKTAPARRATRPARA
jgi:predicted transposase YdaD